MCRVPSGPGARDSGPLHQLGMLLAAGDRKPGYRGISREGVMSPHQKKPVGGSLVPGDACRDFVLVLSRMLAFGVGF